MQSTGCLGTPVLTAIKLDCGKIARWSKDCTQLLGYPQIAINRSQLLVQSIPSNPIDTTKLDCNWIAKLQRIAMWLVWLHWNCTDCRPIAATVRLTGESIANSQNTIHPTIVQSRNPATSESQEIEERDIRTRSRIIWPNPKAILCYDPFSILQCMHNPTNPVRTNGWRIIGTRIGLHSFTQC